MVAKNQPSSSRRTEQSEALLKRQIANKALEKRIIQLEKNWEDLVGLMTEVKATAEDVVGEINKAKAVRKDILEEIKELGKELFSHKDGRFPHKTTPQQEIRRFTNTLFGKRASLIDEAVGFFQLNPDDINVKKLAQKMIEVGVWQCAVCLKWRYFSSYDSMKAKICPVCRNEGSDD
jgi:seryl-tRNA synthetase